MAQKPLWMMDRSETYLVAPRIVRAIGILGMVLFTAVSSSSEARASEEYKALTRYDSYFLKYSSLYFGSGFDWRYFKAQAIVESNLKPHSQSQDGALGLMQIHPRTFREITRKNPRIFGDPKHPPCNIAAGIYYNRILWDDLQRHLTVRDRINFMFACYNAGKHAIVNAQKAALLSGLDPRSWESVTNVLVGAGTSPGVDTVSYVKKINKAWMALQ